jgi:hypothetical protein
MAPKKLDSKSKKEILRKKRKAEKLRYLKIKSDPQLWELQKKKEQEKYQRKLASGKVKPVSALSGREHRNQKKQWRVSSRKYYAKKTAFSNTLSTSLSDTPSCSNSDLNTPVQGRRQAHIQALATKRKNKNREAHRRKLLKLHSQLQNTKRKLKALQTREHRRLLCDEKYLSPRSKVKKIMKSGDSSLIAKKLLFSEMVSRDMKSQYCRPGFRNFIRNMFTTSKPLLKRYRAINQYNFLSSKLFLKCSLDKSIDGYKMRKFSNIIRTDIRYFFESDNVSRMCPGKKYYVTQKKIKMQKRLLLASMKDLHVKFNQSSAYKVGYSTFCKLKPFWVRIPKVSERDTCVCKVHANIEYLVSAMNAAEIIDQKTPKEVAAQLCCDTSSVSCLQRSCTACQNCTISFLDFEDGPLYYDQWVTEKVEVMVSGKMKKITRTLKKKIESTVVDSVNRFEDELISYMKHEGTMIHQYREIDALKKRLNSNEALVHCDFSENYATKYADEIQAFHFGGNRKQFTLHTVQVYYKPDIYSTLRSKSFCTLSKYNDHSAPAVWAHLQPIFKFLRETCPQLNTIHFLSDSPSTQYRNKTLFYLFSQALQPVVPAIQSATWNYSAAGHGKGAPDGIGGTLKRTADRIVAQGADINCFENFVATLQASVRNIELCEIEESDVKAIEEMLPHTIKQFVGTMKVQQVVYFNSELTMKSSSCLKCINCNKFSLGKIKYNDSLLKPNDEDNTVELLQIEIRESEAVTEPNLNIAENVPTTSSRGCIDDAVLSVGLHVLVKFDNFRKRINERID